MKQFIRLSQKFFKGAQILVNVNDIHLVEQDDDGIGSVILLRELKVKGKAKSPFLYVLQDLDEIWEMINEDIT